MSRFHSHWKIFVWALGAVGLFTACAQKGGPVAGSPSAFSGSENAFNQGASEATPEPTDTLSAVPTDVLGPKPVSDDFNPCAKTAEPCDRQGASAEILNRYPIPEGTERAGSLSQDLTERVLYGPDDKQTLMLTPVVFPYTADPIDLKLKIQTKDAEGYWQPIPAGAMLRFVFTPEGSTDASADELAVTEPSDTEGYNVRFQKTLPGPGTVEIFLDMKPLANFSWKIDAPAGRGPMPKPIK